MSKTKKVKKIGNTPFTHEKVRTLPYGFNSSGIFQNRRERREVRQKTKTPRGYVKQAILVYLDTDGNYVKGSNIDTHLREVGQLTSAIKYIYHLEAHLKTHIKLC